MYKISIITVVFNDVLHIEKTIQNVLEQTYPNLEYIIIDGASTDGTIDIVKRYEDRLMWVSESDHGIYDAMMKGTRKATGEWILFRHSGDFFAGPSVIEDLFSHYTKDNNEDFLLANCRMINNYGYKDVKPGILTNKSLFDGMPVIHPSTFIRKRTQLKYPFHIEYKNSADYYFFLEAFRNNASFRYFDITLSLMDCERGATVDNNDITIKDNISIFKIMGAPSSKTRILQRSLRIQRFLGVLKKILPSLYLWYVRGYLRKTGWVKVV